MSFSQRLTVAFRQRSTTNTPIKVICRFTFHTFALVFQEIEIFEHAKVWLPIVSLRSAAEILLRA